MNRLNWHMAKLLVDVPYISLPNWICGSKEILELLQDEVTGESIAREAANLLDPLEQKRQRDVQKRVRSKLGEAGAAERTARIVTRVMDGG